MKRVGVEPALHGFADGADLVQRWSVHVRPTRIQSLKEAEQSPAAGSHQVAPQQHRWDSSPTHLGVHLGEIVPFLGQVDDLKGENGQNRRSRLSCLRGHGVNTACNSASSPGINDVN